MSPQYDAASFYNFLAGESKRIAGAFREVEQLQAEFQGAYTRFKTDHDKTLAALGEQVLAIDTDQLPPTVRAQIDARVPVERQTIAERLQVLDKSLLPDYQKKADDLLQRVQKDETERRSQNPKLNEREEALKAEGANWQKQLNDLNTQVGDRARGLGFIFNAGKIHALDGERQRAIGRLEVINSQLAKVREEWKDLRERTTKEEADWKTQWQTTMQQMGKLRQERDYLAQNVDTVARQRAVTFVLDNIKTPISDSALQASVNRMVDLNIQTDDFQAALGSVAGILGVMKGVDEGLKRIGESVKAIIAEQERNSQFLRPPKIEISDRAAAFSRVWDEIAAKAKDEKAVAAHPADFVAAMKPILEERLTKDRITDYFNSLGNGLQAAGRGWSAT